MKELRLSQKRLALLAGVGYRTVERMVNAQTTPRLETMILIDDALTVLEEEE